ncbi:MAG: LCP family protein [Syntrophomonadaceae bacterium]|nr:LCP family protein [Syntrophomonadaceae bacterium]
MAESNEGKNYKKPLLIFAVLMGLIIASLGFYTYSQLNKIDHVAIDQSDEALGINTDPQQETSTADVPPLNFAIFGIDQWDNENGRTDVIMVVSIDKKNKKVKLSSIMRDTYVNIPGHGMDKINHAYAYGGPQLAINTINSNFNMDIKDFATVDFTNMEKIVDHFGGVDINVFPEEVSSIDGVKQAGLQHLNGKQAVDYMRLRNVGNGDYQRTGRQRDVLAELIIKIQAAGPAALPDTITQTLPLVTTSLNNIDILKIGMESLAANIQTVEKARFPIDSTSEGKMIKGTYYLVADLNANTTAMHDFIYNDKKYADPD